jgi:hypothetical protein
MMMRGTANVKLYLDTGYPVPEKNHELDFTHRPVFLQNNKAVITEN